jgi:DNA mismatch endonuclease, patch repair protein
MHASGFRFRLHRRDLPGRPDLVLPRHRLVILVHGCFWHQHAGCRLASKPKTHKRYWRPKLAANVERDQRNAALLRAAGWRVETIWECEARKQEALAARIADIAGSLANERARTGQVSARARAAAAAWRSCDSCEGANCEPARPARAFAPPRRQLASPVRSQLQTAALRIRKHHEPREGCLAALARP